MALPACRQSSNLGRVPACAARHDGHLVLDAHRSPFGGRSRRSSCATVATRQTARARALSGPVHGVDPRALPAASRPRVVSQNRRDSPAVKGAAQRWRRRANEPIGGHRRSATQRPRRPTLISISTCCPGVDDRSSRRGATARRAWRPRPDRARPPGRWVPVRGSVHRHRPGVAGRLPAHPRIGLSACASPIPSAPWGSSPAADELLRPELSAAARLRDVCSLLGRHGLEGAVRHVHAGNAYVLASDGHGDPNRAHAFGAGPAAARAAGVSPVRGAQLTCANPHFSCATASRPSRARTTARRRQSPRPAAALNRR